MRETPEKRGTARTFSPGTFFRSRLGNMFVITGQIDITKSDFEFEAIISNCFNAVATINDPSFANEVMAKRPGPMVIAERPGRVGRMKIGSVCPFVHCDITRFQ